MIGDEYICAVCEGTFTKGRSDEETMKDYRAMFGNRPHGKLRIICDGCNDRVMEWWNSLSPAERARITEEAEQAGRKQ